MPLEHLLAMYYKPEDTNAENDDQLDEKNLEETNNKEHNTKQDDIQDTEDNPFLNQRITRGCMW